MFHPSWRKTRVPLGRTSSERAKLGNFATPPVNHDGIFPQWTVSFNLAPGPLEQELSPSRRLQQRLAIGSMELVRGQWLAALAGDSRKSFIGQIRSPFVMALFCGLHVLGVLL